MITPRQLFLNHLAQTSEAPLQLEVERAHGVWLYGPDGRKHLDLISGVGMSPLGHTHPAVVKAVEDQARQYMHVMVYGEYILSPQVKLARRLAEVLPDTLDNVYLVNSGTEATEGAMKLAKRFTGRPEIISARKAYHGSTQGAMSLMSDPYYTDAYRPLLPGVRHIGYNAFEDLDRITSQTAGVVIETVQAESGITVPDPDWIQALRRRCTETGTLLILDEIQCGYGRTGYLWAFEGYGIVPDILLIGKGMGGGMPIAAFIASREKMQVLSHTPVLGHITTFGGHPVSAAAALATLDTLMESTLIQEVKSKSDLFDELLAEHPAILEIRRAGFMMSLDLGDAEAVQKVIQHALQEGVVADWFLFNMESIRISPPLIISEEEIRWGCNVLRKALDEVL
ncbi:MAG: aspartate aminotransferase family protein [Saprospiraceae bacterium]|nr:aspartate aminotransferase family protein [Saprospiraceae bacterium]